MKKKILVGVVVPLFAWSAVGFFASAWPRPFCRGLNGPEAVCYSPRGAMFVAETGQVGRNGDGRVSIVENDTSRPLALALDDPRGIAVYDHDLYVTDRDKIVRIDQQTGRATDYLTADRFPMPPRLLTSIAVDRTTGLFLVADSASAYSTNAGAAADDPRGPIVYSIDARTLKITVVADRSTIPGLGHCAAVAFEGAHSAVIADAATGVLHRVRLEDGAATQLADGLPGVDGLVWDYFGRLFVSSSSSGNVYGIPRPGAAPVVVAEGLTNGIAACLYADGASLVVADRRAGTLKKIATTIPGWEVDERPIGAVMRPAFVNLQWTGWHVDEESGRVPTLRPICLTNAGDGSHRLFVATQQGVIQSFPDDDSSTETKIFLDLSSRVSYSDQVSEEGLLGLAFHPRFRDNGELFVFYTDRHAQSNVVVRFRAGEDRATADLASAEVIYRFDKQNDYHNGGAITFGADGYLYISHGDGGPQGDTGGHAQNLALPLGKVLRIDVDRRDYESDKAYGIPTDNPFVARDDALPEVWCYGLRNTWRMACDRKTGRLWGGDVGQGFFEEVNILEAGKNYGWNQREGLHPFGAAGCGPRSGLIDPVWEYGHALGPSITGGTVYRGRAIPELDGAYLYGDYVSNRIWALRYDDAERRVTANRPLGPSGVPLMSFGEDEQGEVYAVGLTNTGRGIYRLTSTSNAAR